MVLYCNALKALPPATTSIEVLQELEDYHCATFNNIRSLALGPVAFKQYWDDVSCNLENIDEGFPTTLRVQLAAYHDVFGGTRPAFLKEDSQLGTFQDSQVSEVRTSVVHDCPSLYLYAGSHPRLAT